MATFMVDVCESVNATGNTVRYDKPEPFPIDLNQVRLVGTYVGPNQSAWGSIYLDPPNNSSVAVVRVHTAQPPMTIRQRMLAANASPVLRAQPTMAAAPVQAASAQAPVVTSRPAPLAPKPRVPATTGSRGF